jgi:hypothetical protein
MTMDTRKAICLGEVRLIGKPEDRTLRMWITDESRDRYNSVISVRGWQLENYMKNPVVLWAHEHEGLPIGHAVATGTVEEKRALARDSKRQGIFRRMYADTKFATREEYAFADVVYKLYLGKHLRGTSVGFRPTLEKRVQTVEEIEESEDIRDFVDVKPGDVVYLKQELAEYSAVPIPGNQNALVDELSGMVPALRSAEAKTKEIMARAAKWDPAKVATEDMAELLAHVRTLMEAEKQTPTKVVVSVPADPTPIAAPGDGGIQKNTPVAVVEPVAAFDVEKALAGVSVALMDRIAALDKKLEERFFLFPELVKQSHIVGLTAQLSDVLKAVEELKARNPEPAEKATAPGAKRTEGLYDGVLGMTVETKRLLTQIEASTRPAVVRKAPPVKVKLPPSGSADITGTPPLKPQ